MDKFVKIFQDLIIFCFIPLAIFLLASCVYLKLKLSNPKIKNKVLLEKYKESKLSFLYILPFASLSLIYLISKL